MGIYISLFVIDPARGPRIHDTLDDLILGVCVGGAQILASGATFRNVSFAGFDSTEIAADGDMARFSIGDNGLTAPREEAIAALREQAGRFGQLLKQVYPQDPVRAREFIEFAGG